ncbi:unnamed protein product, partial [Prunus brigantina]
LAKFEALKREQQVPFNLRLLYSFLASNLRNKAWNNFETLPSKSRFCVGFSLIRLGFPRYAKARERHDAAGYPAFVIRQTIGRRNSIFPGQINFCMPATEPRKIREREREVKGENEMRASSV